MSTLTDGRCSCPITLTTSKGNVYTGDTVELRLCCLAREVEKLSGRVGQIYVESELPSLRDWDTDEAAREAERAAEISQWEERAAAAEQRHQAACEVAREKEMPEPEREVVPERPAEWTRTKPPAWIAGRIAEKKSKEGR